MNKSAPASLRALDDVSDGLREDEGEGGRWRRNGEGGGERRGVEAVEESGDRRMTSSMKGDSVRELDRGLGETALLCAVAMLASPVGVVLDDRSADDVMSCADRVTSFTEDITEGVGDVTGVSVVDGLKRISVV